MVFFDTPASRAMSLMLIDADLPRAFAVEPVVDAAGRDAGLPGLPLCLLVVTGKLVTRFACRRDCSGTMHPAPALLEQGRQPQRQRGYVSDKQQDAQLGKVKRPDTANDFANTDLADGGAQKQHRAQ